MTKSAKTEPKDQLDAQNAMPEDEFVRDMAKLHESDGIVADGDTVQRALSQLAGQDGTTPLATSMVPGYEDLRLILELAYEQAASGKGKERHATGPTGFRIWSHQPIMEIGRMVGPGYAAGQVAKKVQEAITMAGNRNFGAAEREALGAIVYAAALYKLVHEMHLHSLEK